MNIGIKTRFADCRRYIALAFVLVVIITAFAAVLGFTSEKTQKIKVHKRNEKVKVINIGCNIPQLNPLRMDEYPEINQAVEMYYKELGQEEDFAESYNDIHVYTKVGQYADTYIAFVQYRMKIKDIYTEVPGMGTLYIRKDERSGAYQADADVSKDQEEYILTLTEHEDVRKLISETQKEYEIAVESDVLLKEALADLRNAYDD